MILNWNWLSAFLTATRVKTLRTAARKCAVTPLTLRSRLDKLEGAAVTQLFEINNGECAETVSGGMVRRLAEKVEAEYLAMPIHGLSKAEKMKGRVMILADHSMTNEILPEFLFLMQEAYNGLTVSVRTSDENASNMVESSLFEGEETIIIASIQPVQKVAMTTYCGIAVSSYHAHHSYLEERGVPESESQLAGHAVICSFEGTGNSAYGLLPPSACTVWVDSDSALGVLVRAAAGIGLFSREAAVAHSELVEVLPEYRAEAPVWLVMHEDWAGTPRMRVVYEALARFLESKFLGQGPVAGAELGFGTALSPKSAAEDLGLDWDDLRVFLAVHRRKSYVAAAHGLDLVPITVRRRIARLETLMGSPLFSEQGRTLALTAAGRSLAPMAAAMEATEAQLLRAAEAERRMGGGSVTIAAPTFLLESVVMPVVAIISGHQPPLTPIFAASDAEDDAVRGAVDVRVTTAPPQGKSSLCEYVGRLSFGLFACREFLDERPRPVSAEDLSRFPLVGGRTARFHPPLFSRLGHPFGGAAFRCRIDGFAEQRCAVNAGVGVGVYSSHFAGLDGKLECVLPGVVDEVDVWIYVEEGQVGLPGITGTFERLVVALKAISATGDQTGGERKIQVVPQ